MSSSGLSGVRPGPLSLLRGGFLLASPFVDRDVAAASPMGPPRVSELRSHGCREAQNHGIPCGNGLPPTTYRYQRRFITLKSWERHKAGTIATLVPNLCRLQPPKRHLFGTRVVLVPALCRFRSGTPRHALRPGGEWRHGLVWMECRDSAIPAAQSRCARFPFLAVFRILGHGRTRPRSNTTRGAAKPVAAYASGHAYLRYEGRFRPVANIYLAYEGLPESLKQRNRECRRA
jgi:hypothetical protein